jgi:hypothetical protein
VLTTLLRFGDNFASYYDFQRRFLQPSLISASLDRAGSPPGHLCGTRIADQRNSHIEGEAGCERRFPY